MSFLFKIWRPELRESIDGKPLVTSTVELLSPITSFPYERLPSSSSQPILAFFLRPEVVYTLIVLYVVSERPVHALRSYIGLDPSKSPTFTALVALHNLLLAIFSAVVAWNSWPIVFVNWMERGWLDTYCDTSGTFWRDGGMGAWSTIFYLSKYYEFLDTWILVLKGKRASFLQVYHHAGIVFTMYGGVASQSAWLLFAVLLNSLIHTLMYTYFFIKTLAPNVEIKSARYLTMAQICQFVIGILSTLGVLWMGEKCDSQSSRFALACLDIYGLGLIALFVMFANQKYNKKS